MDNIVFGRNAVLELLRSDINVDCVYIASNGGSVNIIVALATEKKIPIKQVTNDKLSKLTNSANHQGAAATIALAPQSSLEDLLACAKAKNTKPFIIVCDELQDPHNLGAIIRTAEAAGADGIIIPKRNAVQVNATVFKTSAGAASHLPVVKVTNIASTLDELKKHGLWIYGADMNGTAYTSADLTGSCAIVIGSEGSGLRRLVKEKCDFIVSLPMRGKVNSLNASVAAGILMYEVVRQRH
jgi:23S rRNA (guanosine2251-2'-O)-methyltransferase